MLQMQFPVTTPPVKMGYRNARRRFCTPKLKIFFPLFMRKANAERILNRPVCGGIHHKIRCCLNVILLKISLLQRNPPCGKIRVAGALTRL